MIKYCQKVFCSISTSIPAMKAIYWNHMKVLVFWQESHESIGCMTGIAWKHWSYDRNHMKVLVLWPESHGSTGFMTRITYKYWFYENLGRFYHENVETMDVMFFPFCVSLKWGVTCDKECYNTLQLRLKILIFKLIIWKLLLWNCYGDSELCSDLCLVGAGRTYTRHLRKRIASDLASTTQGTPLLSATGKAGYHSEGRQGCWLQLALLGARVPLRLHAQRIACHTRGLWDPMVQQPERS